MKRRLLLLACLLLGCGGEGLPGAYLLDGGDLLLVIDPDDRVVFAAALGEGSCIPEAQGTRDGSNLYVEGFTFAFERRGNRLELHDPNGFLAGTFLRVRLEDTCYVHIPAPGATIPGAQTLTAGPTTRVRTGKSRPIVFDVPVGTTSAALYVFGAAVGTELELGSVVAPSGVDLLFLTPELAECFVGYCVVSLPKTPSTSPAAGRYTATLRGEGAIGDDDLAIRLVLRSAPVANPTTFHVRAFVGPTTYADADLMASLAATRAAYAVHGVDLVLDGLTHVDDSRFSWLIADALSIRAQAFMNMGDPGAINLFFVDDLAGIEGLFGLASGIPGSLGVAGPWNGVLINLATHLEWAGDMHVAALSDTLVHEVGHLLGLYHTTESPGTYFDILADTPECHAGAYDLDRDGVVLADECAGAGGDHVMFWTPSTTDDVPISQDVLSADQLYVLERAVIGE